MFTKIKTGRKLTKMLVVASSITASLAFTPSASASVNLVVSNPTISYHWTYVTVDGENGWHPTHYGACTNIGAWDDFGQPTESTFTTYPTHFLEWTGGDVVHAKFSCPMVKTVVSYHYEWRWRNYTKTRYNTNTSSRSHSAGCKINSNSYWLHLDCWGGSYAQANYRFVLPSDARYITRSIRTYSGCCEPGTIRKYWSGNTAIVRVTNWRSVWIRKAQISYQHRVQVRIRTETTLHDTGVGQF